MKLDISMTITDDNGKVVASANGYSPDILKSNAIETVGGLKRWVSENLISMKLDAIKHQMQEKADAK